MTPTLTIFIDGLPFDQLPNMPFSLTLPSQARLIPILGYSVNCQTELFTGRSPDELGFWCEWSLEPETSPFRAGRLPLRWLGFLETPWLYPLKRVFHRVLDRFAPVSYTKNIPVPYLPWFDETGHSVFSPTFDQTSLLDHPKLTSFLYHQFPPGEDQDERIFRAALDHLRNAEQPGSVLLTLVKIDSCSHWQGVDSPPYQKVLADSDRYIRELTEAFLAREPEGIAFVVSDHGMSNIETTIRLDLEKAFGRPSTDTYTYFSEATILRVWVHDPELRDRIANHLDHIEGLRAFRDDEREADGITRPEFGDLIYYTDEGVQIVPSFWGPKPSFGMHGHHPRHPGQHGVCLASRAGLFDGSVRAKDFYQVLAAQFES